MKTSKIFSITFIIIIFCFSFGIFFNYIVAYFKNKTTNEMNEINNQVNHINWREEYPIDEQNDNKHKNNTVNNSYQTLYNRVKSIISKIDICSKNNMPNKIKFIELGNYITKILGCNLFLELDNLIKLDNGYFCFITDKKRSFEKNGERTVKFAQYLENEGVKFSYILCPSKISKFKKDLPIGIVDYSNENADSFMQVLRENNVNVLDLRDDLKKDFSSHCDAFFKTDHHWKPETGFWASQKIIKYLNQTFKQNIDESIIIKENFDFKNYPQIFLGSQGKKVTLALAQPDDFTLITPKFTTNFNFEIYSRGIIKKGSFVDSLIDKNNLVNDYYNRDVYSTYLSYGRPVFRIQNLNIAHKTPKLLIIMDSYLKVVLPFLACVFKEIVAIDANKRVGEPHFDGSIKKFINKEKPDFVLLSYNAGTFNDKDSKIIEFFSSFY
jgi:hypothetical protein